MTRSLDLRPPEQPIRPPDDVDIPPLPNTDDKKPRRKLSAEALQKLQDARKLALERKKELKEAKQVIRQQDRMQLDQKARDIVYQKQAIQATTPAKTEPISSEYDIPEQLHQHIKQDTTTDERYNMLLSKIKKIDQIDEIVSRVKKIDEVNAKFDIMMEEKAKARKIKEQNRKEFYDKIPVNIQKQMMEEELQNKEVERFRNKWFGNNSHIRGLKF